MKNGERNPAFSGRGVGPFGKKPGFSENALVVYIEGDGFAWKNRVALSADPTPKDPVGLRLAVQDQASTVLYLGRPCHYTGHTSSGCHPRYWSSHRYSPEVVGAVSDAIDQAKGMVQAAWVDLVGFSGGGAVAALLAAQRGDVFRLTTIGANLDHAAWTAYHQVTPLDGSLNPADFAMQLQTVPQIHFVGGKDIIVPESVVRAYRNRMTDPSLTQIRVIPEYDHHCCWVQSWHGLRNR